MTEKLLFQEERLRIIYEEIKKSKKITVNEIATDFSISKTTARNDLVELENRGLITKTHGGAILKEENDEASHLILKDAPSIHQRKGALLEEKRAIGELAASLIEDGDTLMIDGGTTTPFVIDYLKNKKNLTIITNSYTLVPELTTLENSVVYLAGGLVYDKHCVVVGDFSNDFIAQFTPNKLLLGIDGVNARRGLSVADSQVPAVAAIKRKMIHACETVILLSDYSKIGKECLLTVAPIHEIDYLITNSTANKEEIEDIKNIGVSILYTKK